MKFTENRSVSAIRHEIVETLTDYLQERIDIDEYFVSTIKPVANIRNAFNGLGNVLELVDLNVEYTDVMEHSRLKEVQ